MAISPSISIKIHSVFLHITRHMKARRNFIFFYLAFPWIIILRSILKMLLILYFTTSHCDWDRTHTLVYRSEPYSRFSLSGSKCNRKPHRFTGSGQMHSKITRCNFVQAPTPMPRLLKIWSLDGEMQLLYQSCLRKKKKKISTVE